MMSDDEMMTRKLYSRSRIRIYLVCMGTFIVCMLCIEGFFCYRLGGEINKVQKLFVSESCLKCRCDRCCSGVVQRRQKEMEAAQPEIRHLS